MMAARRHGLRGLNELLTLSTSPFSNYGFRVVNGYHNVAKFQNLFKYYHSPSNHVIKLDECSNHNFDGVHKLVQIQYQKRNLSGKIKQERNDVFNNDNDKIIREVTIEHKISECEKENTEHYVDVGGGVTSEDYDLDRSNFTREIAIELPDLGGHKGKVIKWYKKEGDFIHHDDTLCDIETEVSEYIIHMWQIISVTANFK